MKRVRETPNRITGIAPECQAQCDTCEHNPCNGFAMLEALGNSFNIEDNGFSGVEFVVTNCENYIKSVQSPG